MIVMTLPTRPSVPGEGLPGMDPGRRSLRGNLVGGAKSYEYDTIYIGKKNDERMKGGAGSVSEVIGDFNRVERGGGRGEEMRLARGDKEMERS